MFSEPFLIRLSSTPLYLLIAFLFLSLFLDLVLVRWWKLSDTAWKKVDYVWLATALLGVLGSSTQAGRFIGANYSKNNQSTLMSAYSELRSALRFGIDAGVCPATSQRSPASPLNVEVEREYEMLCERYKVLFAKLPTELPNPPQRLDQLGFTVPQGNRRLVGPYLDMLKARADWYEGIRQDMARWEAAATEGDFEGLLLILGPLLIAFAVALRVTKVTGELKNARRRAAAPPQ